ncbi:MAG: hypothetical protein FWH14_05260 [Oscillospiraceae bacterium]|nr:hypothetical protein [Oscillospiraceae bacterium]
MSKLIILNGASGAGKTFLLEQISMLNKKMTPIKKYTTRKPRDYEDTDESKDLFFNSTKEQIQRCKYWYLFRNESYGIKKKHIDEALENGKHPIVIIRDYPTIIDLKRDYSDTLTFYIQGAYSNNDLKKLLINQGRNNKDVEDSIVRNKKNFDEYIKYLQEDVFDHMLLNYYDETFMTQVEYFLEKDIKGALQ